MTTIWDDRYLVKVGRVETEERMITKMASHGTDLFTTARVTTFIPFTKGLWLHFYYLAIAVVANETGHADLIFYHLYCHHHCGVIKIMDLNFIEDSCMCHRFRHRFGPHSGGGKKTPAAFPLA